MGIPLASDFNLNAGIPLDDRFVLADIPARDALTTTRRYDGMILTVLDDGGGNKATYQMKLGTVNQDISDNGNWVVFGGGGGGAITDGQGTTANGTAVDLGGSLTSTAQITVSPGVFFLVREIANRSSLQLNDGSLTLLAEVMQLLTAGFGANSNGSSIFMNDLSAVIRRSSTSSAATDALEIGIVSSNITLKSNLDPADQQTINFGFSGGRSRIKYLAGGQDFIGTELVTEDWRSSKIGLANISNTVRSPQPANDGNVISWNNSLSVYEFVDLLNQIAGKNISADVSTPTISVDGYSITWNETNGNYELVDKGSSGSSGEVQLSDGSGGFKSDSLFTVASSPVIPLDTAGNLVIGFKVYTLGNKVFIYDFTSPKALREYDSTTGVYTPLPGLSNISTDFDIAVNATYLFQLADPSGFIVRLDYPTGANQAFIGASLIGKSATSFALDNNKLYVATPTGVFVFDGITQADLPAEDFGAGVLSDPRTITINSGKAYIAESSSGNNIVHVYDIATKTRLIAEEFGSGLFTLPSDIKISGGKAYVSDVTANNVFVFDVATGTRLISEEQAITNVSGIGISNQTLYAVNSTATVTSVSVSTPSISIGLQLNSIISYDQDFAFANPQEIVSKKYVDDTNNTLVALSADPADPANGESIIWLSDGTGTGNDGDIVRKITNSVGVTKTTILVDFNALP